MSLSNWGSRLWGDWNWLAATTFHCIRGVEPPATLSGAIARPIMPLCLASGAATRRLWRCRVGSPSAICGIGPVGVQPGRMRGGSFSVPRLRAEIVVVPFGRDRGWSCQTGHGLSLLLRSPSANRNWAHESAACRPAFPPSDGWTAFALIWRAVASLSPHAGRSPAAWRERTLILLPLGLFPGHWDIAPAFLALG